MFIKAAVDLNPEEYVGGKILESFDDDGGLERSGEIFNCIYSFSSNYLVCHTSISSGHGRFELWTPVKFGDIQDLFESMAIKEGVDLIDHQTYLEVVAYYGNHKDVAYLYPISQKKIDEISQLVNDIESDEDYYGYALDDAIDILVDADSKILGTPDEHIILQSWG